MFKLFMFKLFVVLFLICLSPLGFAQEFEIDLELGEEINEVCAGCHGEFGEGGKQGEYPRLAGLPEKYLIEQMKAFKDEKRKNMPMRPYANERELPDQDLPSIAAFLSQLQLTSKMPKFEEGISAYEKLLIAKKVFNIPKVEGDVALGEKIYNLECRSCHGRNGLGKEGSDMPQLTGQYTEYMMKQFGQIARSERPHDDDADLFAAMKDKEIQAILAYLSIMDD